SVKCAQEKCVVKNTAFQKPIISGSREERACCIIPFLIDDSDGLCGIFFIYKQYFVLARKIHCRCGGIGGPETEVGICSCLKSYPKVRVIVKCEKTIQFISGCGCPQLRVKHMQCYVYGILDNGYF